MRVINLKQPTTKAQPVVIVHPKKHYKKKLKTTTLRSRNNKILPDRLISRLPLKYWGMIQSGGTGAGTCFVSLNTILTASGQGPFVAGNVAATRFTSSAAGSMYGIGITAATLPSGFDGIYSSTVSSVGLYSRYTVLSVSYKIEFIPVASADDIHLAVYPELSSSVTAATTINSINEAFALPFAKNKVMSYIHSKKENTVSGKVDIAQFVGVSRQELINDSDYSGYVDTTGITLPAKVVNLILWQNNTRNVGNTNAIPFRITLSYETMFSKEAGRLMGE